MRHLPAARPGGRADARRAGRPAPHPSGPAPRAPTPRWDAFAVTAPGLAPLCAEELRALGVTVREVEEAGVAFDATSEQLWAANLWLRTASRVLVRLAEFKAMTFAELEQRARRVAWERVLDARMPVRLRVTCRKSRLYHSDAVAERVAGAIAHRTGAGAWSAAGAEADEAEGDEHVDAPADGSADAQLLVVRFLHDRCTISADSSGALLHRRGYRQALGRAPLRETLAAAMLLAAGYDGSGPLVDPLCGSGTIPIEAALISRRIAPGRHRAFAFERWPGFDAARWRALLAAADARVRPASAAIVGADRDAGVITAARANAERAGVADDVLFERQALSDLAPPDGTPRGWLVTNPPYGKRVGELEALRPLWARLGQVAALQLPGWRMAVLAPHALLEGTLRAELGADLELALRTTNGGIPVRVMRGVVPG